MGATDEIIGTLRAELGSGGIQAADLGAAAVRILRERYGRPTLNSDGPCKPQDPAFFETLSALDLRVLRARYVEGLEVSDICLSEGISEDEFRRIRASARTAYEARRAASEKAFRHAAG